MMGTLQPDAHCFTRNSRLHRRESCALLVFLSFITISLTLDCVGVLPIALAFLPLGILRHPFTTTSGPAAFGVSDMKLKRLRLRPGTSVRWQEFVAQKVVPVLPPVRKNARDCR